MHLETQPKNSRRATRFAVLAVSLIYAITVACMTFTPVHGWSEAFGPVVPHDTFPADCSLCHLGGDWHTLRADFRFDHEKETGVALVGAHAQAGCLLCHNDRGPVAQFAARGCAGCHADPHRAQLGANCTDCHDEVTWLPREAIARHDRTRFPLVGAHAAAACFRCHPGAQVGNFAGASSDCAHCHGDDLARATNPDHQALGYASDCARCHLPTDWRSARFDHPASFPLTLGHGGRACRECHTVPNVFTGLSTDCSSCHLDDYQATQNPNHVAANYPTDCRQCHGTAAWRGAGVGHPASFPLTNAHARACTECHTTPGTYAGLSPDCASCHLPDYQATTNPPHVSFQMGTQCQQCHGTTAWSTGTFSHAFPITSGKHAGMACFECHNNAANRVQFSCIDCHEHRQSSMASEHQGVSGYTWTSAACYQCHPNGRG
ncbi:MAG: hypothetical protein RL398_2410 [Planctomycetota bacterium]